MELSPHIKPELVSDIKMEAFSTSSIEQKYLVKCNGKRFEVTSLIYNLVNLIDGKNNLIQLAEKYSDKIQKKVSVDDIKYIIENILSPKGFLKNDNSNDPEKQKNNSYLYFRISLISQNKLQILTSKLKYFFTPVVFKILLFITVLFQFYFFVNFKNIHINIYSFDLGSILLILFLYFLSTLFHELGHSSSCDYYGAEHGNIGLALYLYYPVFYADVTDIWKLSRKQRIVVDFAGIYFQLISIVFFFLIYIVFNNNIFLYAIILIEASLAFNLNPFFRFDGYWIFSDFTGIPNLRQRSIELISYFAKNIIGKKDLIRPYIFNIRQKEKFLSYAYLVITLLFFLFIFYKIVFILPQLLMQYPTLLFNTVNSIINHLKLNQWKEAWQVFSSFIFPTLIMCMLIFMTYRMFKGYFLKILKFKVIK